jgi:hypothetical protein
MSATGEPRSAGHRFSNVVLKTLAWIGCVVVLLSIGLRRADTSGGDVHFQQGYALGSVLVSLALAFVIWFLVQHVWRKRGGFPPWIGLIAIGISLLLLLVDVGQQSVADAACVEPVEAYGAAPAGWTYAAADPETRARVVQQFGLEEEPGLDISFASNEATQVLLLGVPYGGPSWVDGAVHGARKADATVTRAPYGDASVLDYPDDAQRTVVGVKACNSLMVLGNGDADVDTVARAVFG